MFQSVRSEHIASEPRDHRGSHPPPGGRRVHQRQQDRDPANPHPCRGPAATAQGGDEPVPTVPPAAHSTYPAATRRHRC